MNKKLNVLSIVAFSTFLSLASARAQDNIFSARDVEKVIWKTVVTKYLLLKNTNADGVALPEDVTKLISNTVFELENSFTMKTDKGVTFTYVRPFPESDPRYILGPAWALNGLAWADGLPEAVGFYDAKCPEGSRLPTKKEAKAFRRSFSTISSFLSAGINFWIDSRELAMMIKLDERFPILGFTSIGSSRDGIRDPFENSVARCVWEMTAETDLSAKED